ncbi:ankyrin repeat-containing domain-containing LTR copia-type protein, partial [Tanacetum coccineum]
NSAPTTLVEETEAEAPKGETEMEIVIGSTKTETESEAAEKEAATKQKSEDKKNLREAAMKGDWSAAASILKQDNDLISSDGSTVLHIAVGIGHNDFVKNLFSYISDEDVVATRNSDGSTALHIVAIVGNTYVADLLIKKNKHCLRIKDEKGEEPLHKAYENMHLDTIGYLLKAVDEYGKIMSRYFSIGSSVHPHLHPGVEIGVDLLVNAISAKQYNK